MKIKLYFENENAIAKSGIGRAMKHQEEALRLNNIEYTKDSSSKDYDILHINTVWYNSWRQARKAKRLKKKIVFHAHSTEEDFKNSFMFSNLLAPLYKKWLIHMYNFGDVIVTPTPYSKRVLESYHIQREIYPISNGINLNNFKKDAAKEKVFREYFQLAPQQKVIICVGWFFERKGFDTFCEVAEQLPEYTFIWFGDKLMSAPTNNIRKLMMNPPKNVILPGYISGDVIKGAYSNADVFFFPSREETEGIVVLEALASETNVLVRDIPVFDGWLVDKENCYMGKNNEQFITLIRQIINKEVPELKEAGYEVARKRSLQYIGEDLRKVYESVLKR
ncbi:MAG: glycosyltransferase family 4 protein [Beduini sp.]|uniref:glycosyltransferase family 4 protein n=1 Tax=Beduini sp. TaxID=1922300 RepID=UPI0039A06D77